MDFSSEEAERSAFKAIEDAILIAKRFFVGLVDEANAIDRAAMPKELDTPEEYFLRLLTAYRDCTTTNGVSAVEDLSNAERDRAGNVRGGLLLIMHVVLSYATQAVNALERSEVDRAWEFSSAANYWAGTLWALWSQRNAVSNPAVEMARLRHAENYALADEVLNYWRSNVDPGLSAAKAAEIILRERIVPLSYKKISELIASERRQISNTKVHK